MPKMLYTVAEGDISRGAWFTVVFAETASTALLYVEQERGSSEGYIVVRPSNICDVNTFLQLGREIEEIEWEE